MRLLLSVLALVLFPLAAHAEETGGEATPLFASDDTLEITLSGPVKRIVAYAERSTNAYPATLEAAGETHAITLAARGNSRRRPENCLFPPLRVRFSEKPGEQSLFHRQGGIKLVTHCRDNSVGEQTVLREYAAYRLYNVLTPESLRVRLVRVRYMDDGRQVAHRLGFFIEDVDDAARRLGRKEVDTGNVPINRIDQGDAARYTLFQYMIGNTDWAMIFGVDPTECCHNSRLLGGTEESRTELTPIPYDFDNSGLVDASYAVPNSALRLRKVTTRLYRGFCASNDAMAAEAARFLALRPELERELAATPHADERTIRAMTNYLAGFFDVIGDPDQLRRKIMDKCR